MKPKPPASTIERWLLRTDKGGAGGCWSWLGPLNRDGYVKVGYTVNASALIYDMLHRVVFEHIVGPIPEGLQLDHLCRNRSCVNPAHLEPVTSRENTLRGHSFSAVNALKTHCKHGHPFDEANTYIRPNGNRDCRACIRARVRKHAEKRAAA